MTTAPAKLNLPETYAARMQLRKLIRQQRNQLTPDVQQQAASALAAQVLGLELVQRSKHFALYLANDGELDTFALIDALWLLGKQVYLPVLHPVVPGYLIFVHYQRDTLLYPNKFGIPEPLAQCHELLPLMQLDVIFTPLVAFDHAGNRLGMGGGFYDRTLAQLPSGSNCNVIGLAHDCQLVDAVPSEAWDIPLSHIITPSKQWFFEKA